MTEKPQRPAPDTGGEAPPRQAPPANFIHALVAGDLEAGKYDGRVATRFPPEPNGYLHIGHAKAICLNFGVAAEFGGSCNLRFDDTNPETEDMEYVEAIQRDIRWLGFDWGDRLFFASDYFEQLYEFAVHLIATSKAYVDDLSGEEIRDYRGSVTEAGRPSPWRDRTVLQNLDLFARMRVGEFTDGTHVLRAKIDMAANNMLMRDPVLYRIRHGSQHYRRGTDWCIYPMYDFTHCLSDAIEHVTHSLCSLEFENNRELYDWVIDHTPVPSRPQQTEFARLNLSYTVVSKRKLLQLVEDGVVSGWDDPRMPTLSGFRRRGYTPQAIRAFCDAIGVARTHNVIDVARLEHAIRDDLNRKAPRVLAVLRPLKVVIENYPEGRTEELEAPYYPHDVPGEGSRKLPFSRRIYIERDDFREDPPTGWFRLAPGREVRLRYAYFLRCNEVVRDPRSGEISELRCTYDPASRGGDAADGRKVKGTLHWVSAEHSVAAQVRLYDRLFLTEVPDAGDGDFKSFLNPSSLETLAASRVEPSLAGAQPGTSFQFERQGYFVVDPDSTDGALIFNRTVTLRDTWAKITGEALAAERGAAASRKAAEKAATKARQRQESRAPGLEPTLPPEQEAEIGRYRDSLGIDRQDARLLAADPTLGAFFEQALAACDQPQAVANWIVNELLRELKDRPIDDLPFGGTELGELVALTCAGTISGTTAKDVFARMLAGSGRPADIVAREGLEQLADAVELGRLVDRILAADGDKVAQYRAGKTALLGFFVGQVMRASGGRADPRQVNELLRQRLGSAP